MPSKPIQLNKTFFCITPTFALIGTMILLRSFPGWSVEDCQLKLIAPSIEECSASKTKERRISDEEIGMVILKNMKQIYDFEKCEHQRRNPFEKGLFKSSPEAYRQQALEHAYEQCNTLGKESARNLKGEERKQLLDSSENILKKCEEHMNAPIPLIRPRAELAQPELFPKRLGMGNLFPKEKVLECQLTEVLKRNKAIQEKMPTIFDAAKDFFSREKNPGDQ